MCGRKRGILTACGCHRGPPLAVLITSPLHRAPRRYGAAHSGRVDIRSEWRVGFFLHCSTSHPSFHFRHAPRCSKLKHHTSNLNMFLHLLQLLKIIERLKRVFIMIKHLIMVQINGILPSLPLIAGNRPHHRWATEKPSLRSIAVLRNCAGFRRSMRRIDDSNT
jgi:hypothetical protein